MCILCDIKISYKNPQFNYNCMNLLKTSKIIYFLKFKYHFVNNKVKYIEIYFFFVILKY